MSLVNSLGARLWPRPFAKIAKIMYPSTDYNPKLKHPCGQPTLLFNKHFSQTYLQQQ